MPLGTTSLCFFPAVDYQPVIPGCLEMTDLLMCEVQQEQAFHPETFQECWEAETLKKPMLISFLC